MAIVVTALGTAINDKASVNVIFNLTGGVIIGDWYIVVYSGDTALTIGASTRIQHSFSLSDALAEDVKATNTGKAISSILSVKASQTTAWSSPYPFIGLQNSNSDVKTVTVYKVTGITDTPLDKTSTGIGTGTAANTGYTGTLAQADELVIGATGVEDEVDDAHGSWVTGAGYVSGNEQFDATNGGADASNIQVHSVAQVVSATTSMNGSDTPHDSTSWAAAIATYKGVTDSQTVTPGTANLVTTLYIPVVTASDNKTVTPGTLALTTSLFAPSVILGTVVVPGTISLATTLYIPTIVISDNKIVSPGTASLAITLYTPTVSISDNISVTPGAVSLETTLYTPSVILGTIVTPGTAILTTTLYTPTVTVAAEGTTVIPGTASLITTLFTPSVILGTILVPGVASLTTTLHTPVVTISNNQTVTPGTLAIISTWWTPSIILGTVVTPNTASLVISLWTPSIAISDNKLVTPGTISLITTLYMPSVIVDGITIIPAPALAVTGIVSPTVILGSVVIIPSPASGIAGVVDPIVIHGSITIVPVNAGARGDVVDPSVDIQTVVIYITPDGSEAVGVTKNFTYQLAGKKHRKYARL